MSFVVLEWDSPGVPARVDGVCCDVLEGPKLIPGMMVVMKCSGCGKVYRNPRINFLRVKANPEFDATVEKEVRSQ